LFLSFLATGCEQRREKPDWGLGYSGQISGLFSSEFVLKVWHQYPGTVHNGTLRVHASGAHINGGKPVSMVFSFDDWLPNEENARTFRFNIDQIEPIHFRIELQAAETGKFQVVADWTGTGWGKPAGR